MARGAGEKIDLFKAFRNKKVTVQEKSVPDDLYTKCPSCGQPILSRKYRELLRVCPHCGAHGVLGVRDRLTATVDEGSFRELIRQCALPGPAGLPRLCRETLGPGAEDRPAGSGLTGTAGSAATVPPWLSWTARFIMGSMSSAVGEKITRLAEYAAKKKLPLIIFCASGGARMQEGIYSLMQMAKTSAAIGRLGEAGCLYISVLTNPTTGGVTASFASLGDIILAEPKALIGFAGPRVIEQTIKQKLPEGFQRAEFLQECGFVDEVVPRSEMRGVLIRLLRLHSGEVRRNG